MPQGRLTPGGANGPAAARAALAALGVAAALAVLPAEAPAATPAAPSTRILHTQIGIGSESQTAPLVQLTPQGTLIRLEGVNRLRGDHVQAGIDGFFDVPLGAAATASLAANAGGKRGLSKDDFDLAMASVQPALHAHWGGIAWGAGLNRGRIDVAGAHFRDTTGLTLDATRVDGAGHWTALFDRGLWRHPGEFEALDTRATSLFVQRHLTFAAGGAIASADLSVTGLRERNLRGFPELASRGVLLQAALQGRWGGAGTWTLGVARHRARFDDTVFVGEPRRADRAWIADASIEWPVTPQHALRLAYTGVFNRSTSALFENRYRQFVLGLSSDW